MNRNKLVWHDNVCFCRSQLEHMNREHNTTYLRYVNETELAALMQGTVHWSMWHREEKEESETIMSPTLEVTMINTTIRRKRLTFHKAPYAGWREHPALKDYFILGKVGEWTTCEPFNDMLRGLALNQDELDIVMRIITRKMVNVESGIYIYTGDAVLLPFGISESPCRNLCEPIKEINKFFGLG